MRNSPTPSLRYAILVLLFAGGVGRAAAETAMLPGDPAAGEKLHATYCVRCHNASVYTRKNRRVNSLSGLMAQVRACSRLPKEPLTLEQVDDLIAYLNKTYYRFK